MEILSIFTGLIIGIIISWTIFRLINKTKSVSKTEHDNLNEKFNETNTQFKIAEDRLTSQQEEYTKLNY